MATTDDKKRKLTEEEEKDVNGGRCILKGFINKEDTSLKDVY